MLIQSPQTTAAKNSSSPQESAEPTQAAATPVGGDAFRKQTLATESDRPGPGGVLSLFGSGLDRSIERVESEISRKGPEGKHELLDRYNDLLSLRRSRESLRNLANAEDLRILPLVRQTLREIENAAGLGDSAFIDRLRHQTVSLETFAALSEKRRNVLADLQTGLPLPIGLISGEQGSLSGMIKGLLSSQSPVGRLREELADSPNKADRKVADVVEKAIGDLDWMTGARSERWSFEDLEKETTRLQSIYGSPQMAAFSEIWQRRRESEPQKALTALKVLPQLMTVFETHAKNDFASVTNAQTYQVRAYLLDRMEAEIRNLKKTIREEPAGEDSPSLKREHQRLSVLNVLQGRLLRMDVTNVKECAEHLQIAAKTLLRNADAQVKAALGGMTRSLEKMGSDSSVKDRMDDVRSELESRSEDAPLAQRLKFYGGVLTNLTKDYYVRFVNVRIEQLKKSESEINRADLTAATLSAINPYGSIRAGSFHPFAGTQAKADALRTGYETVRKGLKSTDPKVLEKALKEFKVLERSISHEEIKDDHESAEIINTFTIGTVIVGAAALTGGWAATLVPETMAGTALGAFLGLTANAAAFTLSYPVFRAVAYGDNLIDGAEKLAEKPWENAKDIGIQIALNAALFGVLRQATRWFGMSFQALLKKEGVQGALKKVADVVASFQKNPALREQLSYDTQQALASLGFQGGALATQVGVLQSSSFLQSAIALSKAGDKDAIEKAFQHAFSPKTVAKEFLFNLALHLQHVSFSSLKSAAPEPTTALALPAERSDEPLFIQAAAAFSAMGLKEVGHRQFTFDAGKKDAVISFFRNLGALAQASGVPIEISVANKSVRVSIAGEGNTKVFTFAPAEHL